jgi:type 1 glutamine amidotransferase
MLSKRKALLLGDNVFAQYHPLQAVEQELTEVFQNEAHLVSTENWDLLNAGGLQPYDLCIAYTDRWGSPATSSQTAGLLSFVAGGGGLLVLHNGISLQARFELSQMIGAKFTGHPPYGPLEFHPTEAGHEIQEGIEGFAMDEEPYRFDRDPFAETTVLLEYTHDGARWPAAWAHEYGLGRVVYLMPGHHIHSFKNLMYRKLILQSGMWACSSERRS